ncbi:hypothetical protein KJ965_04650, partial [Patescibacteria group bacterium]|nr:hypothetical protein [Patescibacteria group bacterium]
MESNPSNERSHWSHFYAPANLTAANENGPIRLNWTSAYGAGGGITYKIYRGSSLIKEGVETNTYLDDTTFNGVNYCYQVVAVDNYDNLESDTSNQDCAPSEYPYTPQPTGLSAACVNRGINLTWDQLNSFPTVSYTYNVHRSLEPWVLIGHTAELVAENLVFSQYRDEDGKDSTTYYYRVSAVNVETELEGDPSDTASAISLFLPPNNLTATNDNGVIDLTWIATGGFGEITYNIYRSDTNDVSKDSTQVCTGISVTHWTDINTDSGTAYWYMVTGVDAFDNLESAASNTDSATSIYPGDARPQKLRAECVNRRAIVLSWQSHPDFTPPVTYTIYRGTGGPKTVVATISDTTWTDTNVVNQIPYYYHITANQVPGNPSNEAYAISKFLAPTNLTATNNNGLSINLSWNSTSGFGSITYNIYRDLQSSVSTSSERITSGLTGTTYSDTGIAFNTKYYYIVTGVDSADNLESQASVPAHITSTHILPTIALISMTNLEFEADSATITYTVTNGPARQVEIVIIDRQTGQEVATIIKTVGQNGVCTASWDGVWTNEPGVIKHNGWYSVKAQDMDVDNSLSGWTATTNDAYVDVVHIQQPVEIEYTTEGQDPPVLGPHYHITYQLTKNAFVVHKIYADAGLSVLVRTISSSVPRMGEGFERDITVTDYWDLRADNGSFVPNGIYYWQITAHYKSDTSTVTVDLPVQPLRLTDLSTVGIAQSGDNAQINYTLTVDATVTIKIYKPGTTFTGNLYPDGNPIPTQGSTALVRTLTFSRGEGSHTESWDGTNDTGQAVANNVYVMSIIALDSHN